MSSVPLREDLDSDDEPDPVPRVRKYLSGQGKEWVVFFRPKNKPLNALRISENLWKNYSGVTDVTKLHQNKLRVVVNNPEDANAIVVDPRFCVEYRVWIPARSVEIDGVVTEEGLTVQQIRKGVGHFKQRNLPAVQILDVKQMGTAEGASKRFVPSSSYRITFAGTALPDFLLIENVLRLPVRLYRPKVMSCTNCHKLGHTKAFCSNKAVCSKCGGKHRTDQCQEVANKCLLCGGTPHETQSCPKYKERSDRLQLELRKRSKRSFAEIVKSAAASTKNADRYAVLAEEEPQEEPNEIQEPKSVTKGAEKCQTRKRKFSTQTGTSKKSPKDTPIPSNMAEFNRLFPPLSANVTNPTPKDTSKPEKVSTKENRTVKTRVSFSTILEMVFSMLSQPIRSFVEPLVPLIKELGKELAGKTTLLDFICFDE